jgi:hypothetical protein
LRTVEKHALFADSLLVDIFNNGVHALSQFGSRPEVSLGS